MQLLRIIHTLYAFLIFVISFVAIFPLYVISSLNSKWHSLAYKLDHIWGLIYFPVALFRTRVEYRVESLGKGPVIYCANHFSSMDIPSLALLSKQACYVGKASIKKIPLFGYMFKTLHIVVNRDDIRDRVRAYKKYSEALRRGKSLFIYPEGGISSTNMPIQTTYKDGAFRVAIEEKVPIVPITLPYNWKVLPDGDWILGSRYIKIVVHEPIETKDLTLKDLTELKKKVYRTIQQQIDMDNNLVTSEPVIQVS